MGTRLAQVSGHGWGVEIKSGSIGVRDVVSAVKWAQMWDMRQAWGMGVGLGTRWGGEFTGLGMGHEHQVGTRWDAYLGPAPTVWVPVDLRAHLQDGCPEPEYQIWLCFGEEYPGPEDPPKERLIMAHIEPVFARELFLHFKHQSHKAHACPRPASRQASLT